MDLKERAAFTAASDAWMLRGGGIEVVTQGQLRTEEMILNIGPQHPSTHGVLRIVLELDGEMIVRAEPVIGYMHRGAEKLSEYRDPRQVLGPYDVACLLYETYALSAAAAIAAVAAAFSQEAPVECILQVGWRSSTATARRAS